VATTSCKRLLTALGAGALACLANPASADNEALLDLLRVLRDNGTIDQAAYEILRNSAVASEEKVQAEQQQVKDEVKAATADLPKIETKDKLKISSPDGNFEWQLIGRLMVDAIGIDSDKTKQGGGTEIRRARLGMEGTLWEHWVYKTEWDFADAEVSSKDQYIGYEQDSWWAKVGQQHIPFGLATMSSSKYMLFMDRPLLADNILQPARKIGVSAFNHWGDFATLHAGVFSGIDGEKGSCGTTCDEQLSVGVRGTVNPFIQDPNHLIHLGAAFWYVSPQDSGTRVRQRPASIHLNGDRFQDVNFGTDVDDILAYNLEAAAIWGPFSLQGEYTYWDINRTRPLGTSPTAPGPEDAGLDGWYVEAGYFLTGESMNFKTSNGVYSSVKPKGIVGKGGIGAWQLAVRYESMDLNDSDAGIVGGSQDSFAIGLNWYVNNTMRFMLDYVQVADLDRPGNLHDGDEPSALMMRSQVFW
jgi:phosphate-selective porin OprO/OprP